MEEISEIKERERLDQDLREATKHMDEESKIYFLLQVDPELTVRNFEDKVCSIAAKYGNLDLLISLHENGYPWDEWTFYCAVEGGNLECVKYLYDNGCPCDSNAFSKAASLGNLECLEFLYENDCSCFDDQIYINPALNGDLKTIKFLHEVVELDYDTYGEWVSSAAATGGSLGCLKYLHSTGCPWDEYT